MTTFITDNYQSHLLWLVSSITNHIHTFILVKLQVACILDLKLKPKLTFTRVHIQTLLYRHYRTLQHFVVIFHIYLCHVHFSHKANFSKWSYIYLNCHQTLKLVLDNIFSCMAALFYTITKMIPD